MASVKIPPAFEDETSYENWIQDVEAWQYCTDLPAAKQAPALFLSLSLTVREGVRSLKMEELAKDDGVKLLTKTLDKIYKKDNNTLAFLTFKEFYSFKRSSGMSLTDFFSRYEFLYNRLIKFKIDLPAGVQAFLLLNACNISEEKESLARTTCGALTYDEMKETLKKIFGDVASSESSAPAIKTEPESVNIVNRGYNKNNFPNRYRNNTYRGGNPSRGGYRNYLNPKDRFGKTLLCYNCKSDRHLANHCPNKNVNLVCDEKTDEIHVTLFSNEVKNIDSFCDQSFSIENLNFNKMPTLLKETLGLAVIDSACSRTVMGATWFEVFQESMSQDDLNKVERRKSDRKFCFGDGATVESMGSIKFPVVIEGKLKVCIEADLVDCSIPLLLSHESCRKARMCLNFCEYKATILDKTVNLGKTSSGHYTISLSNKIINLECKTPCVVLNVSSLEGISKEEKMKKAKKLHRQFGHAPERKLIDLVRRSEKFKDEEFTDCIRKICQECSICEKFRRQPLRPIVGLPVGSKFNETVCMDLKEYVHNQSWILHLIDSATRYSTARIVTTKKQEVIIQAIYESWIVYFGPPVQFLSDNGGEFSNQGFRDMCEKMNIKTKTTAAESPFSNGMCERHNLVVFETMKKVLESEHCDPKTALAWGISAKNALSNHLGYSPNELVFGYNVNMGSVLTDDLPALDNTTVSDSVRINMNARNAAKKAFMDAEASEKIKRALNSKIRTYADVIYEPGMKVYYKRNDTKGWKGPAVVLGVEGKCILIRHGGAFYRMHSCQVMKVKSYGNNESQETVVENKHRKENRMNKSKTDQEEDEEVRGRNEEVRGRNEEVWGRNEEVRGRNEEVRGRNEEVRGRNEVMGGNEEVQGRNEEVRGRNEAEGGYEVVGQYNEGEYEEVRGRNEEGRRQAEGMYVGGRNNMPKIGEHVRFLVRGEDWRIGRIMKSQPKSTGTYSNWRNVNLDEGTSLCVNWDNVIQWQKEDVEYENVEMVLSNEVIQSKNQNNLMEAKMREIENMKANDVYDLVPYTGQNTVSSKWVISEKMKNNAPYLKARIVAKGYEEDSSSLRTDSPTCSRESLRLVWMVAGIMSWKVETLDFTAAFLQGDKIERDVYLRMPDDVCPSTHVWKLKRCIYGLNDAPRSWYKKVVSTLTGLKGVQSTFDNGLFMWHRNMDLAGVIAVHVDDFTLCGNQAFKEDTIMKIKQLLKVGTHEFGTFKFLGLNVCQTKAGIRVDQNAYVSELKQIEVKKERAIRKDDEVTAKEKKELKRLAGQLLWVTTQTRPEMMYDACKVSNVGKHPKVNNLVEANLALQKLKSKKGHINFLNLGNPNQLKVICYSDATYASLPDGSSQGGFIVFVQGSNGLLSPLCWSSKKLNRVTRSPLASEAVALNEAADAAFLISAMIQEIFQLPNFPPVLCRTDSASLVETLQSTNLVTDKRLRIDVARLREMEKLNEVHIEWVKGIEQLSDPLTKSGASAELLREVLHC